MLYETLVRKDSSEEKALRALIGQLTETTGLQVEVQELICFATENADVSSMLDSLRDAIRAMKPIKVNHRKNGHGQPKERGKKKEVSGVAMTSHTKRNLESGEVVSTQTLRKMISEANGRADANLENTVWEDIKGQHFVVLGGELVKEPKSS